MLTLFNRTCAGILIQLRFFFWILLKIISANQASYELYLKKSSPITESYDDSALNLFESLHSLVYAHILKYV